LRQQDPDGRELLISCGAALLGLRLGLRSLGLLPAVDLLPDDHQPDLLARVHFAGPAALTKHESELLRAVCHRHTHRGPFVPAEMSSHLVEGLRADATAERAELVLLPDQAQISWLTELVRAAGQQQAASPQVAAELRRWVRDPGSAARDGVAAFARAGAGPESAAPAPGRLPQRDFGQPGTVAEGGAPPQLTAVLTTTGDAASDWIQAGQALHRILLHAATRWVFASLQSQPLELPALRAELRSRLGLPGEPQMLLQFGRCNVAGPTARRPAANIIV
jgi:hypothetical protein